MEASATPGRASIEMQAKGNGGSISKQGSQLPKSSLWRKMQRAGTARDVGRAAKYVNRFKRAASHVSELLNVIGMPFRLLLLAQVSHVGFALILVGLRSANVEDFVDDGASDKPDEGEMRLVEDLNTVTTESLQVTAEFGVQGAALIAQLFVLSLALAQQQERRGKDGSFLLYTNRFPKTLTRLTNAMLVALFLNLVGFIMPLNTLGRRAGTAPAGFVAFQGIFLALATLQVALTSLILLRVFATGLGLHEQHLSNAWRWSTLRTLEAQPNEAGMRSSSVLAGPAAMSSADRSSSRNSSSPGPTAAVVTMSRLAAGFGDDVGGPRSRRRADPDGHAASLYKQSHDVEMDAALEGALDVVAGHMKSGDLEMVTSGARTEAWRAAPSDDSGGGHAAPSAHSDASDRSARVMAAGSPRHEAIPGSVQLNGRTVHLPKTLALTSLVQRFRAFDAMRDAFQARLMRGRDLLALLALLLVSAYTAHFFVEFTKIFSTTHPFYTDQQLNALSDTSLVDSYFGRGTRPHARDSTTMLVIFDGCRADRLTENEDLADLVSSPDFTRDAWISSASSALPTMSVPNWVTLLSGATPERHGVLGNLLVPETDFDTLFRQAKLHAPSTLNNTFYTEAGMTASPWMAGIVRSTLPYLRGDGTIATSVNSGGNAHSANGADVERGKAVDYATSLTEVPYSFFLAHFSDVDVQGHAYGVTDEWNSAGYGGTNSYQSATTNKTEILRDVIDTAMHLSEATGRRVNILMTADHGHVDRGGHGGPEKKLHHVPFVLWQPGSAWGARTSPAAGLSANATALLDLYEYSGGYSPDDSITSPETSSRIQNTDSSATLAMLMGVPVPRQSEGRPLARAAPFLSSQQAGTRLGELAEGSRGVTDADEVVVSVDAATVAGSMATHHLDQYLQKARLNNVFLSQLGASDDVYSAWSTGAGTGVNETCANLVVHAGYVADGGHEEGAVDWVEEGVALLRAHWPSSSSPPTAGALETAVRGVLAGGPVPGPTNTTAMRMAAAAVHASAAECVTQSTDAVQALLDVVEDERTSSLARQTARNLSLSLIFGAAAFLAYVLLADRSTLLSPSSITAHFCVRCCPQRCSKVFAVSEGAGSSKGSDGAMAAVAHKTVRKNWRAIGVATAILFFYAAFVLVTFVACFRVVGYDLWDSTLVHSPDPMIRYLAIVLVPSCFASYLIVRGLTVYATSYVHTGQRARWKPPRCACTAKFFLSALDRSSRMFVRVLIGSGTCLRKDEIAAPGERPFAYLVQYWLLLSCVGLSMLVFILGSAYTFIFPGVFRITLITPTLWVFRFRVLTLQLMTLPLLLGVAFSLWTIPLNTYSLLTLLHLSASNHMHTLRRLRSGNAAGAGVADAPEQNSGTVRVLVSQGGSSEVVEPEPILPTGNEGARGATVTSSPIGTAQPPATAKQRIGSKQNIEQFVARISPVLILTQRLREARSAGFFPGLGYLGSHSTVAFNPNEDPEAAATRALTRCPDGEVAMFACFEDLDSLLDHVGSKFGDTADPVVAAAFSFAEGKKEV